MGNKCFTLQRVTENPIKIVWQNKFHRKNRNPFVGSNEN